jgi:hypothetical protein
MAIGTKNGEIELLATDSFQRVALIEVPDRSAVFPVAFGTDGRALIAVPEGTRRSLYIDLAGLRSELKEMGLDWDWPDLPPDTSASEVIPKIIFEQAQE